jgi:transcriptional regulator with XRE-family HTH domain
VTPTEAIPAFGQWITAARTARNVTIKELAARAKINARTLREIETGKRPNPSHVTRDKLKRALEGVQESATATVEGDDGGDTAPTASEAYGEWLLSERSAGNLTRQDLAEKAGINPRTLREIERGKRHGSPATRKNLEAALGSSPPTSVKKIVDEETTIEGVGQFADFNPHDPDEIPNVPGVYVFYDISDRPI